MPSNDAGIYSRADWPEGFDPARAALGIIDADGTLKLSNDRWGGDGRDRQAPKVFQVKPGANCSQALRLFALRGDESAKRVLRAFNWTLSGVARSVRCEFFESGAENRWFDITINMLPEGTGLLVTSIDITPGNRSTTTPLDLPVHVIGSSGGFVLRKITSAPCHPRDRDGIAAARTETLLQRMRRSRQAARPPEAVNVNQLVRDVVYLVDSVALTHGVQIEHSLDTRNTTVSGDARELRQMLIALVLHAVTLTLNGNPLQRRMRVTTIGTSNTVNICLENQCPESFGVGLGMPLVRRVVDAHGGSMTTQHTATRGFNVQIALPKVSRKLNRFRFGPYME